VALAGIFISSLSVKRLNIYFTFFSRGHIPAKKRAKLQQNFDICKYFSTFAEIFKFSSKNY